MLALELEEARVLDLMATGSPIRAHMAHLDEAAADLLVEVFVAKYRTEREGRARTFPGIPLLLRRLRDRGVPLAVVTSKLREDVIIELAATGLDEFLDLVIAFEDSDAHKPAAAPHLAALRSLGVDGGVGVGDLPSDVVSARAAGLRALAVAWGYGDYYALRAAGAERVCPTPTTLAEAIDECLGGQPVTDEGVDRHGQTEPPGEAPTARSGARATRRGAADSS